MVDRLAQLGIRQARYFGRVKTKFQLYLAATVDNLTLVASKMGPPGDAGNGPEVSNAVVAEAANTVIIFGSLHLGPELVVGFPHVGFTASIPFPKQGFPARFPGGAGSP